MRLISMRAGAVAALVVVAWAGCGARAQCVPEWVQTGKIADVDSYPGALAAIQRAGGAALIVTGSFAGTRDGPADGCAMFDGVAWHAISRASGMDANINKLVGAGDVACTWAPTCPEGTSRWFTTDGEAWVERPSVAFIIFSMEYVGGELYALGGTCETGARTLYRFDGADWVPVGPTLVAGSMGCLEEYHDELIIGGAGMLTQGSLTPLCVAALRGGDLVGLGTMKGTTTSLAVQGDSLCALGKIDPVSAPSFNKAHFWNGSAWTPVPNVPNGMQSGMAVDGVGQDLVFSGGMIGGVGSPSTIGASVLRNGVWTTLFANQQLCSFIRPVGFGDHGTTFGFYNGYAAPTGPHLFTANPGKVALTSPTGIRVNSFGQLNGITVALAYSQQEMATSLWHYNGQSPILIGGQSLPIRISTIEGTPSMQEFDGQLFVIGSDGATGICYRWNGFSWQTTAGLPAAARRLYLVGGQMYATGDVAVPAARWNGAAWETAVGSPLNNRVVLAWDGVRVLTTGASEGHLSIYDGTTLTDVPVFPIGPKLYSWTFYRGELFAAGNAQAPGTYRFHNGAWEQTAADTAVYFIVHRDMLYRNGNERWTGSAWTADASYPITKQTFGPEGYLSLSGDLFVAGEELRVGGVVSYGSVLSRCRCRADVTGDGVQELDDYFAFFNAFDVSGEAADVNFDGAVDLADFFFFFEYWDAGCGG